MSQEIRNVCFIPLLVVCSPTHDYTAEDRDEAAVGGQVSWTRAFCPAAFPRAILRLPLTCSLSVPECICPGCSHASKACLWILCSGVLTLLYTLPLPLSFSDQIPTCLQEVPEPPGVNHTLGSGGEGWGVYKLLIWCWLCVPA